VVLGFAWALFVPAGQAPDEPSHIAYVQVLAERFDVPQPDEVSGREHGYSTEQRLARDRSHQQWQYAEPTVKSEWDPSTQRRWRQENARLGPGSRSDGGGPNSAAGNPPLYYAYEALPYYAASGGDFFDRLFAMRTWSALLLAAAVVATWLLMGELTGGDRLYQVIGSGVVGLQPMASFISASINPDAGLVPLWALAFWLGLRLLRGRAGLGGAAALVAVTAGALLVKASSLALLPAVAFALAVAARRALLARDLGPARLGVLVVGGTLALAAAVVGTSGRLQNALQFRPGDVISFLDYLWQAYLPNLPFQTPIPMLAAFEGYDIWIRTGWAAFGWLEIQFPAPVYALLAVISVGIVGAGVLAIAHRRFPLGGPMLTFFALTAVALVAVLHWVEFHQFVDQRQSFIQGRYLLGLLPLGGVLTAAAVANLSARWRAAAAGAVLGGLFALQLFSLGLVAVRFYV
jgi:4-amino-4-deoxy-L-arabinose transferase-like glycosyltransferase